MSFCANLCEYQIKCFRYQDYGCIGYYFVSRNGCGKVSFDGHVCEHEKEIREKYVTEHSEVNKL
ncbi:MAG: hypothetical protein V1870_05215 [Candidatus Aenigmatarchaeota archaeon]